MAQDLRFSDLGFGIRIEGTPEKSKIFHWAAQILIQALQTRLHATVRIVPSGLLLIVSREWKRS